MIRDYHVCDLDAVMHLFFDTVHSVNRKDYSVEACNVWAGSEFIDLDAKVWQERLSSAKTFILEDPDEILGFISLDDKYCIDYLFIHKNHQKQGYTKALMAHVLSTLAKGLVITTHASITAKGFFERMGMNEVKKQVQIKDGVEIFNYFMSMKT